MPLPWEERKRLLRIAGVAEQLLGVAQAGGEEAARAGLDEELTFLMEEVHGILAASDPAAADEFERVVRRGPGAPVAAELRTAALIGWLKTELALETVDEQRAEEAASRPEERRKQTIGFKIRSPITREHPIQQRPTSD